MKELSYIYKIVIVLRSFIRIRNVIQISLMKEKSETKHKKEKVKSL